MRENVGFDFGAWGHGWALGGGLPGATRLLLVNDSIIGPLGSAAFATLIARLRECSADMVGLTENRTPHRHLQSYFLAIGPRALRSNAFRRAFLACDRCRPRNWSVDAYESSLTRQLEHSGLSAAALFPPMYDEPRSGDDTMSRWRELIDAGFTYVKASLLRSARHGDAVRALVPASLLPPQ